jgi:hypothetical protein
VLAAWNGGYAFGFNPGLNDPHFGLLIDVADVGTKLGETKAIYARQQLIRRKIRQYAADPASLANNVKKLQSDLTGEIFTFARKVSDACKMAGISSVDLDSMRTALPN